MVKSCDPFYAGPLEEKKEALQCNFSPSKVQSSQGSDKLSARKISFSESAASSYLLFLLRWSAPMSKVFLILLNLPGFHIKLNFQKIHKYNS